ncbi:DUF4398 domain-containing protein [Gilvimarinus sp. F26214L]|uniref:DUF4398 domain-containing protein n=1 Tax=Gilvimarinus sp. DZF01 TaxID=3461371 RepID=UPI0040462FF7
MRTNEQTGKADLPLSAGGGRHLALGAGLAVLLLGACASQDMTRPVAQMTRAETAIENAIQAGARDSAPLELQTAERHFSQAEEANLNENFEEALMLAEKAEADADVAESKARTAQTYETVAELKEGIRVLQEELERSTR